MEREILYAVLKSDLEKYERIFLVVSRQKSDLLTDFCNSNALRNSKYRVLILSAGSFPDNCSVECRKITEKDCNMLYTLYSLYEFSDRFRILSKENRYGNILNFYDTSVLDMEAVFEAVLL